MLDRRQTVAVTFDGEDAEGFVGESVLECARRNGVHDPFTVLPGRSVGVGRVPHLCRRSG